MKPSSAFENYMFSEQSANPRLTIDNIKEKYAQDDEIRLQCQKQQKEKFELMLYQKQKQILEKYGLHQKYIEKFEFKNLTIQEYISSQKQQFIPNKEKQKDSIQVVVRCSYDKNLLSSLLKIHKYLLKFGISDFQVYITRGQAKMLFITIYREAEQINLWNDSIDLIQNDYAWLVETIKNRIKLHLRFNSE